MSPYTAPVVKDAAQVFLWPRPFALEAGGSLPELRLAYRTWGTLNDAGDNAVWVLHALTGDSDAAAWWPGLIGPGRALDTDRYFVVCANMPGSCYGSSGPLTIDPATGEAYHGRFPTVTHGDITRAFQLLRDHLGIRRIALMIGGSTGGQQVLEWACQEPAAIARIAPITANARHSPWGIGFNEAQRMALEADASFGEPRADAGHAGLAAARAIAMISYRSAASMNDRQREEDPRIDGYRAASYLRYQGKKLTGRFNAYSYHLLTRAMDSHDVGRGRGGTDHALAQLPMPVLSIGVDSDLLFLPEEQRHIASATPKGIYREIHSPVGHDAFLIEIDAIARILHEEGFLT